MAFKKPLISVIILCHTRRDYVINAIKSVLHQSIDRDNYDVVLVKYFEDPELDEIAVRNGIHCITSRSERVGGQIIEAVEYCRGEIVSFLDDDDIFLPNKLKYVTDIFSCYPEIALFKHAIIPHFRFSPPNHMAKSWHLNYVESFYCDNRSYGTFKIFWRKCFLNNSSISVRKSLLYTYSKQLENLFITLDVFLFIITMLSGSSFLYIPVELSVYNIGSAGSTHDRKSFSDIYRKHKLDDELFQQMMYGNGPLKILSNNVNLGAAYDDLFLVIYSQSTHSTAYFIQIAKKIIKYYSVGVFHFCLWRDVFVFTFSPFSNLKKALQTLLK